MVAIIRVLYVDDEPTLLEIGKLCLEKEGQFIVDTLTSATEALERLNTVQYDAIVSDYQMSGMDGLEFLKYLRSHGQQLPFILFTGKGREEVMIEALNSGADFYLQKGGEPRSQFVELQHKIRLAVEQRQTKDKLSESRQRMTDIIDHLPDATFAIDLDGRVIVWNRAMEEMTGVPPEQILGTGNHSYALPFYGTRRPILLDLVLGEDKETERKYPQIIRKDKKLISEIYIPLLYGGKGAYVWFIASPLYDTHGNIIGAIESLRDITDRKVTEDALKENEQNYRALVESSFDGIVIHQNGSVVYANITAVHLLGGTSERQVLGIPILELTVVLSMLMLSQHQLSGRVNLPCMWSSVM
ncbi:MAG: response regulator [Methanoregula sp.]|nr:response regulator [Methanoregula sp.]